MSELVRGLVIVSFLIGAEVVCAHPHAWVDVRSSIVMSSTSMAVAIEEEWIFDELYTSYVVEVDAGDPDTTALSAAKFAGKAVSSLRRSGYFMVVRADGRRIQIGPVEQYRSELRGKRLVFQFTAPLIEFIDPELHRFELSVYDPTYFIEMLHDPKLPPSLKGASRRSCVTALRKATPGLEAVTRALMMDRSAKADDTLGELFAEKVVVVCQ